MNEHEDDDTPYLTTLGLGVGSRRPLIVDGYEVERCAASEIEDGATIVVRYLGLYTVKGRRYAPARKEGQPRKLILLVDRPPFEIKDDDVGLVVNRMIRKVPKEDS